MTSSNEYIKELEIKLTKDKLLELYSRHDSLLAISKELNITINTLKKYSEKNEIDISKYTLCLDVNHVENLRHLKTLFTKEFLEQKYKELGSASKIAKQCKCAKNTVVEYLKKFDIEYTKSAKSSYNFNENFFSEDNEASFYFAGFMAADGCVKDRKGRSKEVCLELHEQDLHIIEKFKEVIEAENKIYMKPKYNKAVLCLSSNIMAKDLERFNIVPRKTHIYTFPNWLLDHELVHHFMRGYNDGDGSFYYSSSNKRKTKTICINIRGTVSFLTDYRNILESKTAVNKKKSEVKLSDGIGRLEYGGNIQVPQIVKFLYKDSSIYLTRKFDKIKEYI